MNYMKIGGHYTFGKEIKSNRWFDEIKTFYNYVKDKEEILFVCHNKKEIEDAKQIDPYVKTFYSKDFLDYMKIYRNAKYGIVNRVHAAFLMASYGAPSFIIGNDSRATMANEIGLESMFINDVDSQLLIDKYENLKNSYKDYKEKFRVIKEEAFNSYFQIISNALKN